MDRARDFGAVRRERSFVPMSGANIDAQGREVVGEVGRAERFAGRIDEISGCVVDAVRLGESHYNACPALLPFQNPIGRQVQSAFPCAFDAGRGGCGNGMKNLETGEDDEASRARSGMRRHNLSCLHAMTETAPFATVNVETVATALLAIATAEIVCAKPAGA